MYSCLIFQIESLCYYVFPFFNCFDLIQIFFDFLYL